MTSKFLTVAALAAAACVLPARASTIALDMISPPLVGTSFDVTVDLTVVFSTHPGDALAAFGFDVAVGDTSVVSYTGETTGGLFVDVSGIFGPSPQVAGFASAGFLEDGDFTEPLTLATLHFQALKQGATTIGIRTDLSDPNQGLFYLTAGADSLDATTTVSPTPEPGTALLGGLALVSLLLCRRQCR